MSRQKIDQLFSDFSFNVECCLCLQEKWCVTTYSSENFIRKRIPCKLSDIDISNFHQRKLPINSAFMCPCDFHSMCVRCIRLLIFSQNEINRSHPLIRCMSPFSLPNNPVKSEILDTSCVNQFGIPFYFSHSDIFKVLTKKEFKTYLDHSSEHEIPGFKIINCNQTYFHPISKIILECNSGIPINYSLIDNSIRGHLIIQCSQNVFCQKKFCYHCGTRVFGKFCNRCIRLQENNDPLANNMYFYNPDINSKLLHFKNKDITVDLVLDQILEKLQQDILHVRCFNCLLFIFKSDQCNGLSHCNIEVCYSCGRSSLIRSPLIDHWSEHGNKGCPRWDYSPFWNNSAKCDFKCQENICYSDESGDCSDPFHSIGKSNMSNFRKKAHIYHMLKSLLPEIKLKVFEQINIQQNKFKQYQEFIPSFEFINSNNLNIMYFPSE